MRIVSENTDAESEATIYQATLDHHLRAQDSILSHRPTSLAQLLDKAAILLSAHADAFANREGEARAAVLADMEDLSFGSRLISETWAKAATLKARLDASGGGRTGAEIDAAYAPVEAMERAVLIGQINTRADAIAKLKFAGMSFEMGNRGDGMDAVAFAEAVAWLDNNAG